jgi:hypothetical protein
MSANSSELAVETETPSESVASHLPTATEKARSTRLDNLRLARNLAALPLPEQTERLGELPSTKRSQVLRTLVTQIATAESLDKKSKANRASFLATLPKEHRFVLQNVLTKKNRATQKRSAKKTVNHLEILVKDRDQGFKDTFETIPIMNSYQIESLVSMMGELGIEDHIAPLLSKLFKKFTFLGNDEKESLSSLLIKATEPEASPNEDLQSKLEALLERVQKRKVAKEIAEGELKATYGLLYENNVRFAKAAQAEHTAKQIDLLKGPGTWANKQTQLKALNATRKKAFTKVYTFTGPICDTIGFQQAGTTCMTDSIQQILLFADPWKVVTQPFFYNQNDPEMLTHFTNMIKCPGTHPEKYAFLSFIRNVKDRFMHHYDAVKSLGKEETCVRPFQYRDLFFARATRKNSVSKEQLHLERKLIGSPGKAVIIKQDALALHKNVNTTPHYTAHLLKQLFAFMGQGTSLNELQLTAFVRYSDYAHKMNPYLIFSYDIPYIGYTRVAFILYASPFYPSDVVKYTRGLRAAPLDHVTALYQCNSEWHYFDDESGIMIVPHGLLEDIVNETHVDYCIAYVYSEEEKKPIFYKIPYYPAIVKEDVLKIQTIEKWSGRRWDKTVLSELYSTDGSPMIVYVFETTVHIASLNSVAYNGLSHKLFLDNLLDTDSHSENNNNYESAYHSGW